MIRCGCGGSYMLWSGGCARGRPAISLDWQDAPQRFMAGGQGLGATAAREQPRRSMTEAGPSVYFYDVRRIRRRIPPHSRSSQGVQRAAVVLRELHQRAGKGSVLVSGAIDLASERAVCLQRCLDLRRIYTARKRKAESNGVPVQISGHIGR